MNFLNKKKSLYSADCLCVRVSLVTNEKEFNSTLKKTNANEKHRVKIDSNEQTLQHIFILYTPHF